MAVGAVGLPRGETAVRLLLGLVVAAVVVLVAIVLWLVRTEGSVDSALAHEGRSGADSTTPDHPTAVSGSGSGAVEASPVVASAELGVGGLVEATDGEVDGFRFESDGYSWYPISAEGPAVFTDVRSTGFARSEEGAALAAIHIYLRASPANPDGYEATVSEQVRGVGSTPLLERLAEAANDPGNREHVENSSSSWAFSGWTVTAFNPLEANVTLFLVAIKSSAVELLSVPVRVIWEAEDWRLVIPDSGSYFGLITEAVVPPERDFSGAFE